MVDFHRLVSPGVIVSEVKHWLIKRWLRPAKCEDIPRFENITIFVHGQRKPYSGLHSQAQAKT